MKTVEYLCILVGFVPEVDVVGIATYLTPINLVLDFAVQI